MLYQALVRPWLFRGEPEAAHERALNLAASLGRCRLARDAVETVFAFDDQRLHQTVFGIKFANPVGLAAGYDKNALGLELWPALGFGFVEIGSVTLHAQPGTEPPRLFRQVEQRALINRMGFNNDGAEVIATRIPHPPHRIPIGINVGKNRRRGSLPTRRARITPPPSTNSTPAPISSSSMSVRRTRPACASSRTRKCWMSC